MSLTAGLRDVLKPDAVLPATNDDSIELREKRAAMRVEIVGLPETFIVIRIEHVGHASKISNGPWRQICDYLLVVDLDNRTHAVFLELKKTHSREEKPREQLRRSLPLLEYLRSVCEIESGIPWDEHGISIHYWILFERTSPRLAKQSVKVDPKHRVSKEQYGGITINTTFGPRVKLATLTSE